MFCNFIVNAHCNSLALCGKSLSVSFYRYINAWKKEKLGEITRSTQKNTRRMRDKVRYTYASVHDTQPTLLFFPLFSFIFFTSFVYFVSKRSDVLW